MAVAGANGYGSHHLRELAALPPEQCTVVAAVDAEPMRPELSAIASGVPWFRSVKDLVSHEVPDVLVLATPIPTHVPLASTAMRAGCHVLLEKPPTASLRDFEALLAVADETGRACQVGFQSLGSTAYELVEAAISSGEIGEVRGIAGIGTWSRPTSYWSRAAWAGQRTLAGVDVVDGVVTNPLAHAVVTGLTIAGAATADDVGAVEVDLYRANDIEADDTSAVRVMTATGTPLGFGLTLCAQRETPPRVVVHGTLGTITFHYTSGRLDIDGVAGRRTRETEYVSLLGNLASHLRDPDVALLSPLHGCGAYMRVHETVRLAPPPAPIPAHLVVRRSDDLGTRVVVRDIEQWCERVGRELKTFTALGAPWSAQDEELARLDVETAPVARYFNGAGTSALDSPHPYIHPVRTRSGVTVTDARPADHSWHAGVSIAMAEIGGHNLWGGPSYLRDRGYAWRSDHGRITHERWLATNGDALAEELIWRGHDDGALLAEQRTLSWAAVGEHWELALSFHLRNVTDTDLRLGSPGSNGRSGGGYGGFFWRLPPCTDVDVRTDEAHGEHAVHGARAPWLAWSADTPDGPFTLILAAVLHADDPWFVRVSEYPGVGAALAWERPIDIPAGASITRSYRTVVADGRLSDPEVRRLALA